MVSVHTRRYRRFLKRLRMARLEAEMTQEAVAEALKKDQSFVSRSERGDRRLDFVEVEILAKLYGKDLSYFSTDEAE